MRKEIDILELTILVIMSIIFAAKLNMIYGIILMILTSSSFVLYKYILSKYISKMYVIFVLAVMYLFFIYTLIIVNGRCKLLEENMYKNVEYQGTIVDVKEGKKSNKVYIYLDDYRVKVLSYLKKENTLIQSNDSTKTVCQNIYPGNKVIVKGIVTFPSKSTNPGQFDEEKYLLLQKIKYKMTITNCIITSNKISILGYISILNNKLCNVFNETFDGKNASIVNALILGKSSLVDENIRNLYTDGGIIHILAISGMHVSILGGIIIKLLSKLKIKTKISYTISSIFLIFYMFLTGLSLSVVRAVMMNVMFNTSKILNRDFNDLNSIFLAGLIILIFNPMNLFNVGFILSFVSTLTIKTTSHFNMRIPFISDGLTQSVMIFLMINPIISYYFYEFQGLSILANLFILPFTNVLMILSLLILPFSYINATITQVLSKTVVLILSYYENVLEIVKSINVSKIVTGKFSIVSIICYYILVICILVYYNMQANSLFAKSRTYFNKHCNALIFIIISIAFIFIASFIDFNVTTINFLDVEHGDCIVLISKHKKTVVIDGGGKSNSTEDDTGKYVLYPFLKYNGIKKINYAIVTHPDNDHIKGIIEILNLMQVDNVILSKGKIEENDKYQEILKLCEEKNVKVEKITCGYNFAIDDITFECIYPYDDIDDYNFESNNYSLCFLIQSDNKRLLTTGDIEKEAEKLIVDRNKFKIQNVDYMKVPHHGSTTSSTKEFVNYIKPLNLIVSGNDSNEKKFRQKVIWNYYANNTKVFYTSSSGMVTINLK